MQRRAPLAGLVLLAFMISACGAGVPSGSAGASGGPVSSGDPVASGLPGGSPGVPPVGQPAATVHPPAAALGVGVFAAVQAESLNLRSAPGTGAQSLGLLPVNSTALVVAGPQEADGYTWYALAAPGLPYASGCTGPDPMTCPTWFGWAAVGDSAGNQWVVPTELQCPDAPTSVESYVAIPEGQRLACFGATPLTLRAYLAPQLQGQECVVAHTTQPEWLHICAVQFLQAEGGTGQAGEPEIAAHLDPALGTCDYGGRGPAGCPYVPFIGQSIEVVAHHDDPAAQSCVQTISGGGPQPVPAAAVYGCRLALVVTEIRAAP
jgi:hypothetical protein